MAQTPKEKAKELIDKFDKAVNTHTNTPLKKCALIAVDEIFNNIDWHEFETPNKHLEYWEQVKQEINNL